MRWLGCLSLMVFCVVASGRDDSVQESFEARQTLWQLGATDVVHELQVHEITNLTAHSGQQSEHIKLSGGPGTHVHFYLPVGRAEFVPELRLQVWVKGNRPGMQVLARVILPREREKQNLDQPLTLVLRGDVYQTAGRWQALAIREPQRLLREQQALLRAELGRDVTAEGAYIDQIVINVYGGRGLNEVWLDDLAAGPIVPGTMPNRFVSTATPAMPTSRGTGSPTKPLEIELNQDRLMVNRKPFFLRGIRYSGTPIKSLRDAGFNTLWIDEQTPPATLDEAVHHGFWLVPELKALPSERSAASGEWTLSLARRVKEYRHSDSVLAWNVASGLTREQTDLTTRAVQAIRSNDVITGRPVAAGVWDGLQPYSRRLDMLGMHRWPLFTGLELTDYREWLVQRGHLAEQGVYRFTWVQTHLPEWYLRLVYDQPFKQEFTDPNGPQPEQIRLLTYLALSAGCRGLGYWSDRTLTDSHQGKGRWLMLALLNQELQLLEPMLATVKEWQWINTRHPQVKAGLLRYDGGLLVLPMWLGKGAQFVPGQLAANNLELVVPGAPQDAQAWEISPVEVKPLRHRRVAGGAEISIPEFGLTSMVIFTADLNQVGRMQQAVAQTNRLAGQWAYELALEQLRQVEQINGQLEKLGQPLPSAQVMLTETKQRLQTASEAWTRGGVTDFRLAYLESQRAMRRLRQIMRMHWERVAHGLDSPVCSPYALSFYTLPQHWQLLNEISQCQVMPSPLRDGSFENMTDLTKAGWQVQQMALDEVNLEAAIAQTQPKEGRNVLKLAVTPKNPAAAPEALERTYLAVTSPTMRLSPGSLVRISGWINIPEPLHASTDGLLFFDSIGGEPLAYRQAGRTPWKKITLYRRVPASGEISVTLALAGIGTVYIDDVRIEPLK